jgi:ABC-type Fe3+ transport system permease subunit
MALEKDVPTYVDCYAIAGGTILALAISIVFLQFGGALGLSMTDELPWDQQGTPSGSVLAIGLWLLWVQVLASLAGGYFAGRMRQPVEGAPENERETRDGAHGLIVWAAGTVLVTIGVTIASSLAALVADPGTTDQVTQQAENILELERRASIIFAFIAASTSLVAGVAAWWAATKGGDHRDNALSHNHYVTFRKK